MKNAENSIPRYQLATYSTSDVETKFEEMHKQFLDECKHKGEEDGRRNLPKVETKFLQPFEREILEKYQSEISKVSGVGGQILQEIHDKKVKPIKTEMEVYSNKTIIPEKIKNTGEERNRLIKEATENHENKLKEIENEPSWTNASRDFKQAQTRFEEVSKTISRRELHIHIHPIIYILVLLFIAICEIPINYQVFVSFRETPLLTLIMAGVLVISLPLLAHSSGKFLRQYKENYNFLWLLGISIILISVLSYFTALLRQRYLATKEGITIEQLTSDFGTFFVISLILFFVGSIASFFAHDPSIEFTEVVKIYTNEKKKFGYINGAKHLKENTERERFNAEKKKIQTDHSQKKSEWENKIQTLNNEFCIVVSEYDKLLTYFQSFERQINDCCKQAIHLYRDINLTYRNNHVPPHYWSNDIVDLKFYFANYKELSENPRDK